MDSDIHFGEIEQAAPRAQLRPDRNRHLAVVPVYGPSQLDLPIFVDVDVLRDMETHAASDSRVELGGVLLGGQCEDDEGRPFVVVTDCLRAQHFESTKGSFKFTHDTWEHITRQREEFPPDLQMVGWYHTHPGWGVFLSGMDLFICDNFFNKPLDVAFVIDPCRHDRGFFQWTPRSSSRIRRTDGFFLTASRFRAAELQSYAAQLEGSANMSHDPRPSSVVPAYSTPVIHVATPAPVWHLLAVLGMLSLQFCLLLIIAWRPLSLPRGNLAPMESDAPGNSLRPLAEREREAEIDAKLHVLEAIVRQGTKAPEGVVQSLVEQTAQVDELRSSLRGQQSLARELDGKVTDLEASLADARRRDERQRSEVAALQSRVADLSTRLQQSQDQLLVERDGSSADDTPMESSWWTSLRMNSKPIGLGIVLGAIAVGAAVAAMRQAKRWEASQIPAGANDREPVV